MCKIKMSLADLDNPSDSRQPVERPLCPALKII